MDKLCMGIIWIIVICISALVGIFIGAVAGMIAVPVTVIGWLIDNMSDEIIPTNDSI